MRGGQVALATELGLHSIADVYVSLPSGYVWRPFLVWYVCLENRMPQRLSRMAQIVWVLGESEHHGGGAGNGADVRPRKLMALFPAAAYGAQPECLRAAKTCRHVVVGQRRY